MKKTHLLFIGRTTICRRYAHSDLLLAKGVDAPTCKRCLKGSSFSPKPKKVRS